MIRNFCPTEPVCVQMHHKLNMALTKILFALVAFAAVTQGLPAERILGGSPAPLGSVPYQVSIRFHGSHFCGGSILTSSTILTAAQCAEVFTTSATTVRAGFNTISAPEDGFQESAVSRISIHPGWNNRTLDNDIALVHLETSLILSSDRRTGTIKLPQQGDDVTGEVTVTGWGTEGESGGMSSVLRTVDIPVWAEAECRQAYGNQLTANMVCAGVPQGGKDSCQGDSGGPAVDVASGRQVAVVSWGLGCGRPGFPGVYTRLSNYISWIESLVILP